MPRLLQVNSEGDTPARPRRERPPSMRRELNKLNRGAEVRATSRERRELRAGVVRDRDGGVRERDGGVASHV